MVTCLKRNNMGFQPKERDFMVLSNVNWATFRETTCQSSGHVTVTISAISIDRLLAITLMNEVAYLGLEDIWVNYYISLT